MKIIRRLYDWTLEKAEHPHALTFLFFIAFVESSVFPIPPDVLLLPIILAAPALAWHAAAVATIGSVLGGLTGYVIGYFFFTSIGEPVLSAYGKLDAFDEFKHIYDEWGLWFVAGAGLTPFPYKVITIASGFAHLDVTTFTLASVVSRGLRFFIIAALLWKFGPPIRAFIERYLPQLTVLFFVLLLGGFVALKYLF